MVYCRTDILERSDMPGALANMSGCVMGMTVNSASPNALGRMAVWIAASNDADPPQASISSVPPPSTKFFIAAASASLGV